MKPSPSLFGIWDLYAGPMHSELILKPEGTYSHSFPLGARGHWGSWGLDEMDGHAVLILQLQGAEPMFEMTPFGPQPVLWPAMERLAISAVAPNVVSFYGALMNRRFPVPNARPDVHPSISATSGNDALADSALGPTTAETAATPAVAGTEAVSEPAVAQVKRADDVFAKMNEYINDPSAPSDAHSIAELPEGPAGNVRPPMIFGGVDFSKLDMFRNPPPAHFPAIVDGWRATSSPDPMNFGQIQMQGPTFAPAQNFAPPTADQLAQQNQAGIDNFLLQHRMNSAWNDAIQQTTLDRATASHKMASKWADFAGS